MYPNPPYSEFTWSMNHHIGVVDSRNLYAAMFAAATYCDSDDPKQEINNYFTVNEIFTQNIREGQTDTWRDYQQVLPELGLIFSTKIQRRITPTPLGLAYLDGSVSFSELMTLQALRYQYPNGQKATFASTQMIHGVLIRPGVLVWQVLRGLQQRGYEVRLTIDELQAYLSRCKTHTDTIACIDAITGARDGGTHYSPTGNRRDYQEWIRFLLKTPLFTGNDKEATFLQISTYGQQNADDIDGLCAELSSPQTFWLPSTQLTLPVQEKFDWFVLYGAFDLSLSPLPEQESAIKDSKEFVGDSEDEDEATEIALTSNQINLRPFDRNALRTQDTASRNTGKTIQSVYDAGLANSKHRLHDLMVIYIAELCLRRGAKVFDDPNTVDLLVQYENTEFLIEVKSVTSRNLVKRLRYALGQLLQYDYLRSQQVTIPRRKVVALTANVPPASWCIPFLTNHLDMDLLSLKKQTIQVETNAALSAKLFGPLDNGPNLNI